MGADKPRPDKLSIVVYSGAFERVHYALAAAAAAAAIDTPATVFFTMEATRALAKGDAAPGWHALPTEHGGAAAERDASLRARGVAGFEELLESCVALDVKFLVCEMGLRAVALEATALRDDVPYREGGLVTFLTDASATGAMLFI